MALIQPSFEGDKFVLNAPGMPTLRVPLTLNSGAISEVWNSMQQLTLLSVLAGCRAQVTVWNDKIKARSYGEDATQWLTKYLGQDAKLCTLVSVDEHERPIPKTWDTSEAKQNINASFSDGFPFLVRPAPCVLRAHARPSSYFVALRFAAGQRGFARGAQLSHSQVRSPLHAQLPPQHRYARG